MINKNITGFEAVYTELANASRGIVSQKEREWFCGKDDRIKRTAPSEFESLINRIDIKDNFHDCWEWTGAKNKNGYGIINTRLKEQQYTHRIVYIEFVGDIPNVYLIRHLCHNKSCCNPTHLLEGTNFDNKQDDILIGNIAYGERNGMSKATEDQAIYIRKNYKPRIYTASMLARELNLPLTLVQKIASGSGWNHIKV